MIWPRWTNPIVNCADRWAKRIWELGGQLPPPPSTGKARWLTFLARMGGRERVYRLLEETERGAAAYGADLTDAVSSLEGWRFFRHRFRRRRGDPSDGLFLPGGAAGGDRFHRFQRRRPFHHRRAEAVTYLLGTLFGVQVE